MSNANDPMRASRKISPLAVWSLLLGLPVGLGVFPQLRVLLQIGIITAIPALICGHLAFHRIKKSPDVLRGRLLAVMGLTFGYIAILWALFVIFVAMPRAEAHRKRALTRLTLHTLSHGLTSYRFDHETYPEALDALVDEKHVPSSKLEDPWGRPFIYFFPGRVDTNAYDLRSLGPDGVESADDISSEDKYKL